MTEIEVVAAQVVVVRRRMRREDETGLEIGTDRIIPSEASPESSPSSNDACIIGEVTFAERSKHTPVYVYPSHLYTLLILSEESLNPCLTTSDSADF